MAKLFWLLVALFAVSLALPAFAVDIYVDNSLAGDCVGTYSIAGRDCSGSDGDAYLVPQDAADVVNPGDVVYFRAGTYYNASTRRDAIVLNVLRSGTLDSPITFTNYNGEDAILSGLIPNLSNAAHAYTMVLGVMPNDSVESGQGVQNIIVDGLIIEGASERGFVVAGPANQLASAQNYTENITIRNAIFRNNVYFGGGDYGGGFFSMGKVVNVLLENCEAYDNAGTGIAFGRINKQWHIPEPEDDMSAAQNCVIRNSLSYNNINPDNPGDTDGIAGSHMYHCIFEDNVAFGNSDDGMDIYSSIESTAKNNISLNHNYTGGNKAGFKYSAGGGGRHTIVGNVAFNNGGTTFEGSHGSEYRPYYPSRLYNNLAYAGNQGFIFGGNYYNTSFPGFEQIFLRNNIGLENNNNDIYGIASGSVDSNYNFISNTSNLQNMQNIGQDAQSLTGNAGLVDKDVVIDTTFQAGWTLDQKLEHIRSQVRTAFSPASASQLIDAGTVVPGYHCSTSGPDSSGTCTEWFGTAPDIGAIEFQGSSCVDTAALLNYITQWEVGSLSMPSLISRIASWKAGTGC